MNLSNIERRTKALETKTGVLTEKEPWVIQSVDTDGKIRCIHKMNDQGVFEEQRLEEKDWLEADSVRVARRNFKRKDE